MDLKGAFTFSIRRFPMWSAWVLAPALSFSSWLNGAEVIKSASNDALQNAMSWVGNQVPTIADIAVWNSTAGNAGLDVSLGATTTWAGIKVTDIQGPLTVRLTGQLNLGDASGNLGLDLSAAAADVLLTSSSNAVINWDTVPLVVKVAANRTLTADLKFGATDRAQKRGDGTLILSGASDNGGLTVDVYEGTLLLNKASSASFHALGGGSQNIYGGTLKLGGTGGDQIYVTAIVNQTAGVFDLNDRSEAIARLVGTGGKITNSGTHLATLTLDYDGTDTASTYAGIIEDGTGQVKLVKMGAHQLSLTGNNTFSGGISLEKGITNVATDASLGAASGKLTLMNGAMLMRTGSGLGDLVMSREVELGGGIGALRASHSQHMVLNGKVTGSGDLRIHNDSGTVFLNHAENTYAGSTIIGSPGSGTTARLAVNTHQALGGVGDLIFSAGTAFGDTSTGYLNLRGTSQTVSSLSTLTGRSVIHSVDDLSATMANAKLIVNGNKDTTYFGQFGNAIRLEHNGTGSLTLMGPNDNSGFMVTVGGGKVILAKDSTSSVHALGGGTHHINNGGTLVLSGTGNDQIYFGATLQINTGGTWDFGGVTSEDINHIAGSGTITNTGAAASKLILGENLTSNTPQTTFGGVIRDGTSSMALEKRAGNTLILNGINTFTGGTQILSGMLGGTGKVGAGPLTIAAGAILSPGSTASSVNDLGAGTLSVDGAVTLASGSIFRSNVALGGIANQTDRLKMMGVLSLNGPTLDLVWGGNESLLFDGSFGQNNMFFLTEGATSVSGIFSNFGSVGVWGDFGNAAYAKTTIGGQDFALFYGAQFGTYSVTGLTGGNDLLLMAIGAVPEPSKTLLLSLALLGFGMRRKRG